jgi:hypothetical protein
MLMAMLMLDDGAALEEVAWRVSGCAAGDNGAVRARSP